MVRDIGSTAVSAAGITMRRATPPSAYIKKDESGKIEFVWSRYERLLDDFGLKMRDLRH